MRLLSLLALLDLSAFVECSPRPRHFQAALSPNLHVIKAPVRRVRIPASRRTVANLRYSRTRPFQPHSEHFFPSPNETFPRTNISNIFDGYEYMVDVAVGNPPQNLSVIFDTGSDQTWLNPQCTSMSHQAVCLASGSYNHTLSRTAQNLSLEFQIVYGSGTVEGWYMKDTLAIAGLYVDNLQLGVATYSYAMDSGIIGLGYDSVFLDELHGQGKVDSKDFSVSLGPNGSPNGEIVFGGVDTKKYTGQLKPIRMLDSEGPFSSVLHYSVNLTYMGVTSKGSCNSTAATEADFVTPALVDTGSTISHVPYAAANRTASLISGARFDPYTQMWKVSCHYAGSADTVDFAFGDVVVNIPLSEFIWRNVPMGGQCYLGLVGDAETIGFSVLGDSFMRALVALYQPEKKVLNFAQYSDCGTDIQSSNGTADNLDGKCERPSWDTCSYRPTPMPLPASTTAFWTPPWPTTTSSVLETGAASFLLPPTDSATDILSTTSSDIFGEIDTVSSTFYPDSSSALEASTLFPKTTDIPAVPIIPKFSATAAINPDTTLLTSYEPSLPSSSRSVPPGPCTSIHECKLTFTTPLGGIASETTECVTIWTCVPMKTLPLLTPPASSVVKPTSDWILPLPTVVLPSSSAWPETSVDTGSLSIGTITTEAAALPSTSSVYCTTSWVYVTVYNTVYSTPQPINTWTFPDPR